MHRILESIEFLAPDLQLPSSVRALVSTDDTAVCTAKPRPFIDLTQMPPKM
jgi:hypothetical protein